jgi:hypothetical protein
VVLGNHPISVRMSGYDGKEVTEHSLAYARNIFIPRSGRDIKSTMLF